MNDDHLTISSWHFGEVDGVRIIKSMVLVETTPEGKKRGHSVRYNEETHETEYSIYDVDAKAQRVWPTKWALSTGALLAQARRALEPFARFAYQWSRKPAGKHRLDDALYAIHTGTEYEAEITVAAVTNALVAAQQIDGREEKCAECHTLCDPTHPSEWTDIMDRQGRLRRVHRWCIETWAAKAPLAEVAANVIPRRT